MPANFNLFGLPVVLFTSCYVEEDVLCNYERPKKVFKINFVKFYGIRCFWQSNFMYSCVEWWENLKEIPTIKSKVKTQ